MISDKFKNDIETIHCVLFVMKASNTRVGSYQKYVFDSVMDLFDKTIAPNFSFILTFSDSGKPPVIEHIMNEQKGFGKYWNQIVQPKYIKVNSCGIFQKIDPQDKISTDYWDRSILAIKQLFHKINTIQPKSLKLSKDLIHKKQSLLNQIQASSNMIQNSINQRQNIKNYIQIIIECSKEMDQNKQFQRMILQLYCKKSNTIEMQPDACLLKNVCEKLSCRMFLFKRA